MESYQRINRLIVADLSSAQIKHFKNRDLNRIYINDLEPGVEYTVYYDKISRISKNWRQPAPDLIRFTTRYEGIRIVNDLGRSHIFRIISAYNPPISELNINGGNSFRRNFLALPLRTLALQQGRDSDSFESRIISNRRMSTNLRAGSVPHIPGISEFGKYKTKLTLANLRRDLKKVTNC